jgi:hypothetical protein
MGSGHYLDTKKLEKMRRPRLEPAQVESINGKIAEHGSISISWK